MNGKPTRTELSMQHLVREQLSLLHAERRRRRRFRQTVKRFAASSIVFIAAALLLDVVAEQGFGFRGGLSLAVFIVWALVVGRVVTAIDEAINRW